MSDTLLNQYPKRKNIRWRWDGEEDDFIIYENPKSGVISIFNPVASSIFFYADGSLSVSQIIDKLYEEYEVNDREYIQNDVLEFIHRYTKDNILLLLNDE
jgi:hypothetical protein